MKSLLIATALTGVALTSSAFAFSPKESAALAPAPRPVPASVVKPTNLPLHFEGALINIEFSLNKDGQPQDIRVLRVADRALQRRVVEAFRQWRFEPGVGDEAMSQKRFILPLQLRLEA